MIGRFRDVFENMTITYAKGTIKCHATASVSPRTDTCTTPFTMWRLWALGGPVVMSSGDPPSFSLGSDEPCVQILASFYGLTPPMKSSKEAASILQKATNEMVGG